MSYEIIIKGYINAYLFEEFIVEQQSDFTTKITGDFSDQAALYGVFRRIQDLGLELIAVQPLED